MKPQTMKQQKFTAQGAHVNLSGEIHALIHEYLRPRVEPVGRSEAEPAGGAAMSDLENNAQAAVESRLPLDEVECENGTNVEVENCRVRYRYWKYCGDSHAEWEDRKRYGKHYEVFRELEWLEQMWMVLSDSVEVSADFTEALGQLERALGQMYRAINDLYPQPEPTAAEMLNALGKPWG